MVDYVSGETGESGEKKKGGFLGLSTGCVACCGCAGLTAVGAVVVGIAFFGYVGSMVGGMVSTEPMDIPAVEYTPAEAFGVNLKFDQYAKAVERGESPTLVFTDKELNIFVADQARKEREEDPDADNRLEGFQLIAREDDSINLKLSQRTGKGPGGKYEYINLEFSGSAEVADDIWDVSLDSLTVGTTEVPSFLLDVVKETLSAPNQDPKFQEMKDLVRSFKVSGGKIELQLDPEVVKEIKAKSEEAGEEGGAGGGGGEDRGGPVGSTADLDVFSFIEDEKAKIDGYDAARHDDGIFEKTSFKFNITKDEARETYLRIKKKMGTGLEERERGGAKRR